MSWVRIDDGMIDHTKWTSLERDPVVWAECMAVWLAMACYTARTSSDGIVPDERVNRLTPLGERARERIAQMAEVGLVDITKKGPRLHDWTDYNPSRAEVDEARRRKTLRQKKWRAGSASRDADVDASTQPTVDAGVDGDVDGVVDRRVDGNVDASVDSSVDGLVVSLSRARDPRPAPPRPRESGPHGPPLAFVTEVINGVRSGFESEKLPPPKQTRSLTWPGWHTIAVWCVDKAELERRQPIEIAAQLVRGFLGSRRAREAGYPLTFLAENPTQFWDEAA